MFLIWINSVVVSLCLAPFHFLKMFLYKTQMWFFPINQIINFLVVFWYHIFMNRSKPLSNRSCSLDEKVSNRSHPHIEAMVSLIEFFLAAFGLLFSQLAWIENVNTFLHLLLPLWQLIQEGTIKTVQTTSIKVGCNAINSKVVCKVTIPGGIHESGAIIIITVIINVIITAVIIIVVITVIIITVVIIIDDDNIQDNLNLPIYQYRFKVSFLSNLVTVL